MKEAMTRRIPIPVWLLLLMVVVGTYFWAKVVF